MLVAVVVVDRSITTAAAAACMITCMCKLVVQDVGDYLITSTIYYCCCYRMLARTYVAAPSFCWTRSPYVHARFIRP